MKFSKFLKMPPVAVPSEYDIMCYVTFRPLRITCSGSHVSKLFSQAFFYCNRNRVTSWLYGKFYLVQSGRDISTVIIVISMKFSCLGYMT